MQTFILLLTLLFAPCLNGHTFKITDATVRNFIMGRKEAGAGKEYIIHIRILRNAKTLSFNKIWVENRVFIPKVRKVTRDTGNETFSKGDELNLIFIDWTHPPAGYTESPKVESKPTEYRGQGLLIYHLGRRQKSMVIHSFRQLPEETGL